MASIPAPTDLRKHHFYRPHQQSRTDLAGYINRHLAEGRLATIGWAHCAACRHQQRWLDEPWFDDDVHCSCSGHIDIGFKGLQMARFGGWRDGSGVTHILAIDIDGNSICACKRPASDEELSSGILVEKGQCDVVPTCVLCVALPTAA